MKIAVGIPPRRSVRRLVTTGVAGALAVAGLVATGGSAQAAQTGTVTAGTTTWGLSTLLASGQTGFPKPAPAGYVSPAAYDAETKASTWGAGSGTVAADGSATLAFTGTTVTFAPTGGGWLRLKDVRATLDASGNGPVTAEVSYGTSTTGTPGNRTYDPAQAPSRGPDRVTVATLAGNSATDRTLTPTSASWTGLDSGAWAPAFIDYVNGVGTADPSTLKWSYASTITNATNRTPLPFDFAVSTVEAKVASAAVTAQTPTSLDVSVTGTGYRAGGVGVYVGVAETGTTVFSTPSALLGAIWSADPTGPSSAVKEDGSFSTTLKLAAADIAKLDPAKSYSVFTIKAHGQNVADASQTASAPLAIDFAGFDKYTSTVTASTISSPIQVGGTASVEVTVSADGSTPGGTVTALDGETPLAEETLTNGKASFALSGLGSGTHSITFEYTGDADHVASVSSAQSVTVDKVTGAPAVSGIPASSSFGAGRTATVTVPTAAGVAAPSGTVTASISGTVVGSGTLNGGSTSIPLPITLKAGTTSVVFAYSGDDSYVASSTTQTFTVSAAKVSVKRGTTKKPTTTKTGTSSLALKSATGAPVDGKVTVTFKQKGHKTKIKTVTIKAGKGSITIPTLAKGRWTVSVKYAGTTNFLKTSTLKRGSFTVVK